VTTAKKRPNPPASAKGRAAAAPAAKSTGSTGAQSRAATSRRGPQAPPKKSFPVLPVVFGVVAVALIGAIVFSSGESIDRPSEAGGPEITGEELPPYATGAQPADDRGVGMPAPAVTGEDFDGNPVSIVPDDGTARAIVFLAHWCPHCQAEVPRVQAWLDSGGGVDGVELVSVTTSMDESRVNYPPSAWLEREGWTPEVLRDSDAADVYRAYGAGGFPFYVFVDGEGNVVRRSSGELDVATLEAYMEEIAG
jgi:cytochrome c biogenesis protein CcmG, thiol:disulfide interchange protein DsbE